jgi:DNA-binding MarR family transcriptional regulator
MWHEGLMTRERDVVVGAQRTSDSGTGSSGGESSEAEHLGITTVEDAANEPRILAFGRLLGAAGGLGYVLGRAIERDFGISHAMFEVLLLLGRTGRPLTMREISQARVLTTGGVTRLVDRMETYSLVRKEVDEADRRVHLVDLTETGETTAVHAARAHAANVQRYMLDALPSAQRDALVTALAALSRSAGAVLPQMP